MTQKELLIPIFLKDGKAVKDWKDFSLFLEGDPKSLAQYYDNHGADGILCFDLSDSEEGHEQSIRILKEMACTADLPIFGGGNIRRMEDVKKLLYAGCRRVFLNYGKEENCELTQEVSDRFGKEKILACVRTEEEFSEARGREEYLGGIVVLNEKLLKKETKELPCYVVTDEPDSFLVREDVQGVIVTGWRGAGENYMERKHLWKQRGIPVNTFETSVKWEELKLNESGLLPVVVQDYKNLEVLMVAYMNQEAFETTVRTGRMTYYSRSRRELWVKGLTSGHFQYVKELCIDCDRDTLLAKVHQVGAACHTGNRSCFYETILQKEYDKTNPLKVFEEVYEVIQDRKIHPKEGSYTNYLFDKGLDKILKKVGEEAAEIIIAAKNPDPEEIKYEISDFLYHAMVLMAEKGVTWKDITEELARR
ncbi:MAG TPA: bifunctional phosphoribosyl-AMP cyclohydrolase/phosphoribosyl-ATP diphosphatase HisIE [Candidatus Choladousia intestinavium]|uniref:Histidine biosynthesis bifunctional protein HisIE n=1 Tax=Candidatus Choladousia intestinavium TaxID=2840727 RepID=A0A9D1DA43_9FIRM|nr:bifunctional phosphoribosyl-AMP cyclohydrolase/phosphoribosyl-ATP diphosphatase HisIE [Candidatus Choladousia intestinavium]